MICRKGRWEGPSFGEPRGGVRVVVECADGAEGWIVCRSLEEAGYRVASCSGPEQHEGPCPLVEGRGCAAAEQADVMVNLLGVAAPSVQDVVHAVRAANPGVGLVTRITPSEERRLGALVDGGLRTRLIPPHASTETILEAVVGVLDDPR